MSDTVIRVENLGKRYIIGHQQEGSGNHKTFRDVIANSAQFITKLNPFHPKSAEASAAARGVGPTTG